MLLAGALLLACKGRSPDAHDTPIVDGSLKSRVTEFLRAGERAGGVFATHKDPSHAEERVLDFGAKQQRHVLWDDYKELGCRFEVLDHHGKTIVARVACWNLRAPVALDAPPPDVVTTQHRNETVHTWQSKAGLAAYRQEIAAVLGAVTTEAPEGALRADYDTLTEPLPDLDGQFGFRCTSNNYPTAGGEAVTRIVAAGRVDLLRAIARGPNPEGRLFGIDALDHIPGGPTPDDRALREKIEKLPGLVNVCRRVTIDTLPPAKALVMVGKD